MVREPADDFTVTELVFRPVGRPVGFAVIVTETGGPAGTEPGTVPTETQLSAPVTETIPSEPPPVFWIPRGRLDGARLDGATFAAVAVKASSVEVRLSCGGGAATVSVTD